MLEKTNGSKIENGSRPLGQTVFDEMSLNLTVVGGYEAGGSVGYEAGRSVGYKAPLQFF